MTLLLGPPSSGKSVLLQALSGRLRASRSLKARGMQVGRRMKPCALPNMQRDRTTCRLTPPPCCAAAYPALLADRG